MKKFIKKFLEIVCSMSLLGTIATPINANANAGNVWIQNPNTGIFYQ